MMNPSFQLWEIVIRIDVRIEQISPIGTDFLFFFA
jgi:hypothetical protein